MTIEDSLKGAVELIALAKQQRDAGRLSEALISLQSARLMIECDQVLREAAELATATGRFRQAIAAYRRLLRRWPADATAIQYNIGSLYRELGQTPRARWWFDQVLAATDATALLKQAAATARAALDDPSRREGRQP
jgi:tetratricopeptide (TPR) repeat protein